MSTFKVSFTYTRTVVTYLEAEDEEAIEDFLDDNAEWSILDDEPRLIDSDETDDAYDEYNIEDEDKVTADFALVGGAIVEVDDR
jgi:hypothetical protein